MGVDARTPQYQRVQAAAHEWAKLGNVYATNVMQNELRFQWVPSFNPNDPMDDYKPFSLSPYGGSCSDDDPVLHSEVEKLPLADNLSEIAPAEAKCACSSFLVEKKPDPDNRQGSNRPCTNLKPVNRFVSVTYFTSAGLLEMLPYVVSGYYACKVDLKSAYFHMRVLTQHEAWLVFRFHGRLYEWTRLSFGFNVASCEWQRMILPIICHLRAQGALVLVYLDDVLVIAP